jgi:hypothetical protein
MPVLQLPELRLQVVTNVNERSNARVLAHNGYIDTVGGKSVPIVLNASAVSIHPTVCTRCMRQEQLVLAVPGTDMFQFPACTYDFKQQPHLGMAVTVYINKSKDSIQHSVAATAYVNFDEIMTGAMLQINAQLNDVSSTPVHILLQGLLTPQQQLWNKHNLPVLDELCSNFNSIGRIEERLSSFSAERSSALKDFLDPHNKDNVHSTLAMPTNQVRHVMNIDSADNAQVEFFKQVCTDECPDFLLKYAPLSAAMLLTTAVKFLAAKSPSAAPVSYKAIADQLTNAKWSEADAELWMQIYCNCLTSIVPTSNTYTGDVSWLVNSNGASVIPNLVGEEQLLLGSPVVQAAHDLQLCQKLSAQCQELFSAGDVQKAELAFAAAHTARLKTSELCKAQDCEDFAADMRNYMSASTHAFVMAAAAEHMIGTPLLCGDARLNILHNTVKDAQQALLACCATQRYVHELTHFACRDCVCIAVGANLTSKYGTTIDEKPNVHLGRDAFADRDTFILSTTPGAAGHACRIRTTSARVHSLDLKHGVRMHVHDTNVLCIQESTSATIFREATEAPQVFDIEIQVGCANTRHLNNMPGSVVRNVTGSIYGDMLTNSGLCASHAADRMGTKDFYKVLCAVGGHSLLGAEKGLTNAPMHPAEILQSMLSGCKDTSYYFGVQHVDGAPMMSLEFELKPEEQDCLRLLARAQAPLYAKSMELILASGAVGTCFLPRLDSISHHMPGNVQGTTASGKQLFVVAQKTPLLCMTDVLKSSSVEGLLSTQKEHVHNVLKNTCKSEFEFFSDHISTDIMLLHTHMSM